VCKGFKNVLLRMPATNQVATLDMECELQVYKATNSVPVENKYSIATHSIPRSVCKVGDIN